MSDGFDNPLDTGQSAPPSLSGPVVNSGKAVASLVLGLLSLVCSIVTAIPGLILGILALVDINKSRGRLGGQGMAIAGLVISAFSLVFVPIVIALLLPALVMVRSQSMVIQSRANMKQLAIAILTYETIHGHFPAANGSTKPDAPEHSWRTMLLPYLESQHLYESMDFSAAWDDPDNQLATSEPILLFCSPFEGQTNQPVTNYVAVVGEGFLFDGAKQTKAAEISDGIESTVMFVEFVPSKINWAEPEDLTFDEYAAYIADPSNQPSPAGGFQVVCADGSVRRIPSGISADELRAIFTIRGNERTEQTILAE